MGYKHDAARAFAQRIIGLGFRVFIAKDGTGEYGFVTDASEQRVLDFSFNDGSSLGGCYGPPSHESGTGWRLDQTPDQLRTADDVRNALYAYPPQWCGKGWRTLTTVAVHLGMYGKSSRYVEIQKEQSE